MYPSKLVSVSKAAFAFCRYSVGVMLWAAFFLRIKELVVVTFLILAFSAILRIRRAPMIVLYTQTLGRIFKSPDEMLDEYGMMFAHTVGATFNLICLVFLYGGNERIGWGILFLLAILKTVAAFGACSALKLYNCMSKGGCCTFAAKKEKP